THKNTDKDVDDHIKKITGSGKRDTDDLTGKRAETEGPARKPTDSNGSAQKQSDSPKPDLSKLSQQARALADKKTCGDPIDMASGQMVLAQTDVNLPGILPLILRRTHLTDYAHGISFGPSWAATLDERIERDTRTDGVWWRREDGSSLYYPRTPDIVGDRVDPEAGKHLPLTYLSRGGSYVLVVQDPHTGLTRHFEPAEATTGTWWLAQIEDRNHNHVTIERGDDDTLLEVTHSGSYHVSITTAGQGRRISGLHAVTEDGPLRLRSYTYDENGVLTEVRNAVDAATHFTYDAAHRITGWRDSNDTVFTYAYDGQGRVTATHGSGGILSSSIQYSGPHDDGTTTAAYTDSLGHTTVYRANPYGQIVTITDPLGATTTQTWDLHDHLLTRTDPLGRATRWEWDDAGDLVSVTTADGTGSRIAYNDLHLPVRITDPRGATQLQTFDERGNCTSRTAPDGAVHQFTHHSTGSVATVVNPLGDALRIDTDAAGLLLALEDAHGTRTAYRRDTFGRTVAVIDPLGATTTLVWDAEGRLLRRDSPDGTTESWMYDGEGSCTSHIDPLGASTRLSYGPFDLLASQVTRDGAEHRFLYDTEQRLAQVIDPLGLTWSYTYDPVGRLTAETDFDGRTTRYSYDSAGQPLTRTNAAGETITYTYDPAGRLSAKDVAQERTEYSYDDAGRLTEAVSASSRLTRTYDGAGRLTTETVDGRTTHYGYDALGRRTLRTTPTGAATQTLWDEFGNRVGLRLDDDHLLAFGHDVLGREIRRTLGDHVALASEWDLLGRLTGQTLSNDHVPLHRREFGYRPDGQPVSVADLTTGQATRYDLDPLGRPLTASDRHVSERYEYDAAGNQTHAAWTGMASDIDTAGTRTFDGTRLLTAGRTAYHYDAAGRLVERRKKRLSRSADVWRYTWDAEDRLTTCTTPDGVTWHYDYDALGRRTAKYRLADNGATRLEETRFSWDGTRLAEEQQPGGPVLTWEYEGHRPLAQYERRSLEQDQVDSRFFAIVTNLVGTPTELVDEQGTLAWRTRSTVWGTTAYNADATAYTPLRHPGQYADPETGFHYNYFRHYDPETARYISPDPLGLTPAPNPLAYVTNPHTVSDPLGLTPCVDLYHATNRAGERSIRTNGIDPTYAPRPMDFGNGFYTTRSRQQAEDWARIRFGDDGVVLHFQVPGDEFEALNRKVFAEGDPELSDFVRRFRAGDGTEVPAADVVEGPMLRNVKAFMNRGAEPRWSGDQVVFFGDTGPLLNRALQ
ncbi:RHS repeat-associated core domain-containing protein, partial [Streptomyces sp. NPDC047315]|uniref:RHS repeat-associated core domain-containing protein n=1 Tax=Streptomyces sp. NPDC047315 TaxID=3155142 RepID=UPI0033F5E76C